MNAPVTRRLDGTVVQKPFAWSYSRLKNWRTCPKRHYHIDVARDVKEDESEELKFGKAIHTAAAHWIAKGTEPPPVHKPYLEPWVERFRRMPGEKLTEQQLAIDEGLQPCEWFAKEAWFRSIADVLIINGPVAIAADWKTGRVLEDPEQLALMASCIFAHHPQVQKIRAIYIWLKEHAETTMDYTREGMPEVWASVWPELEQLRHAYATTTYPAKPSRLCRRWCPVSACPHHGQEF